MLKGDVANLNQSTFIKEAPCKVPCCMDIEKWRLFSSLSVLVCVHSPTSIKYRVTLSSYNDEHETQEVKDIHLVLIFSSNT